MHLSHIRTIKGTADPSVHAHVHGFMPEYIPDLLTAFISHIKTIGGWF